MTTDRKNRLKECTRLIEEAMKCLENNDKQCVTRLIEELVRNQCHNGNAVGKEVADGTRGIVHKLWLSYSGDDEHRCRLLMLLRSLGASKGWVRSATRISDLRDLNRWLRRCGISWKSRAMRNDVVKEIEDLLRERFGWDEVRMCEEMWKFVGIDVNALRRYGIEPCTWLVGLDTLSDLRNPYWLGLRASDLSVKKYDKEVRLILNTTNAIDAIFFLTLLVPKAPSLGIEWYEMPAAKYVHKLIALSYYVYLRINEWPWPIELSAGELEKILNGFSDEELSMFLSGIIDGDGKVYYVYYHDGYNNVFVEITACKNCPKRFILDVLRDILAKRFNIIGIIYPNTTTDVLKFYGEKAVRLLRLIRPFVHHPLRRLRIELILAYYDGRISREEFKRLYEMTEYELGGPDIKRNHALEALTRAAPQTHTHGG